MGYDDLRHFLETLERHDELCRVAAPVDTMQEIAEITDRVSKSPGGGKALLFEQVKGSALPVATNAFGSLSRMCLALQVDDLSHVSRRLEAVLEASPSFPQALEEFSPSSSNEAPCQEVTEEDLSALPALVNWAGDGIDPGGRFLTLPLVFTRDVAGGNYNCGMYRVEVVDGRSCGIHWYPGSGGARHCDAFRAGKEAMPVAIALGSDPAVTLAAATPLPDAVDEMAFAGFLRGEPVQVVECRTSDLRVPANAEIVIEGFIAPGECRHGGKFGNHTGFYVPGGKVPLMRVSCITRREKAIFPATVVGPPPMEDCFMAKAIERLMLPMLRTTHPELTDISMPIEGIFHGTAIVSIRKSRPGQGRSVIERLWSDGWLKNSRLVVVVDDGTDPVDLHSSLWRVLNMVDWQRDLLVSPLPGRNPALPFGGRLGIDATRKSAEEWGAPWPTEVSRDAWVRELVTRRWAEYGI